MSEFSVLVPWRTDNGPRERIWKWVKEWWELNFPNAEIIAADSGDQEFSRGKSRNLAAERASTDLFIIADADTICRRAAILLSLIDAEDGKWGFCYDEGRYYNASQEYTEIILSSPPDFGMVEPQEGEYEFKLTSTCGMIFMPRKAFDAAEGYNIYYRSWGFEDDDFRIRVEQLYNKEYFRTPGYAVHLWHPVTEKDRFEQPNIEYNRSLLANTKRQWGLV